MPTIDPGKPAPAANKLLWPPKQTPIATVDAATLRTVCLLISHREADREVS
jgi:hypothetical protein